MHNVDRTTFASKYCRVRGLCFQGASDNTNSNTRPAQNSKRVAASKLVAERTRQAREAQKKATAEAAIIIANNKANNNAKKSAAFLAEAPAHDPAEEPAAAGEGKVSNGLSTTAWMSIIGNGATILTTYVKREDIKAFLERNRQLQGSHTLSTEVLHLNHSHR